jgi:hypothetical protein
MSKKANVKQQGESKALVRWKQKSAVLPIPGKAVQVFHQVDEICHKKPKLSTMKIYIDSFHFIFLIKGF